MILGSSLFGGGPRTPVNHGILDDCFLMGEATRMDESKSSRGGSAEESPRKQPQILAALVQAMLLCAIREGLDPQELLDRAELSIDEIEPIFCSVPYTKVIPLIQEIEVRRPNINLGFLMGQRCTTPRLGPLGHLLTAAPNIGAALRDFIKFHGIINGGLIVWQVSARPGFSVVHFAPHPELADIRWILEVPITMMLTLARELSGRPVLPVQVSFGHQPRRGTEEYEAFFGIPICWGAQQTELVWADTTLDLPVRTAHPGLYPGLLHRVENGEQDARLPSVTVESVKLYVSRTLRDGHPLKASVAHSIGISARTLTRRLADENTTFETILDQIRRELSLKYLSEPTLTLAEIANLLGYSEQSPFFRAFMRWFGSTPAKFRAGIIPKKP